MNIIQFIRILWAYRWLTGLTTAATLIGAVVAIIIVPPAFEAKTRVMLNILKPDPVTGEVLGGPSSRTYIATQKELITDESVAEQAVDRLGWANSPEILSAYAAAGSPGNNIRQWLAQRIITGVRVNVVSGTNILELSFRSPSPTAASAMANAVRDAYIETTLASRKREAMRNADWFSAQANREKGLVDQADAAKTAYERANGIVMQDDKTDVETARLRALAAQSTMSAPAAAPAAPAASSGAAIQLAQLDAQIAQASRTLGPNHPALIEMKARRASLAKIAAQEQAAAQHAAGQGVADVSSALNRALAAQTSRVIANRDKIERLNQLQAEVNTHREQMEKALARAAELRQEAAVADPGISVLSDATAPRKPAFPNKPLILGGGLALGLAGGLLLSLLIELLQRRVRGVEDLQRGLQPPFLGFISSVAPERRRRPKGLTGWRLRRPRPATV